MPPPHLRSVDDVIDEDADLRSSLAALGPAALRELQEVLTWPEPRRDALLTRESADQVLSHSHT